MDIFEGFLPVWVFLCIVVGIAADRLAPDLVASIGRLKSARVNLPVGALHDAR
jgi:ACR3 family arsenite transporter